MSECKFSIIIPLYNKAAHIVDTLYSVIQQDVGDFEVLVVDDGSKDDGAKLVEAMHEQDPRIHLIRQNNGGVSKARNTGIAQAKGDYLCFLDGDDLWARDFLSEICELIKKFPTAGAYSTAYSHRFNTGKDTPVLPVFPKQLNKLEQFEYDFFAVASRGEVPIMPSSCCIPKRVLDQVGGFPEGEPIGEDQDLWIRIAYQWQMAYSRTICTYYLQESDNRACINNVPDEECPYSRRLLAHASTTTDSRRRDMLRVTANHLLHLAQLNILAGKKTEGKRLLRDKRTFMLPKRRLKWELKLLFMSGR
jgi:glycosyltransferase involved in cell wall biosynthesis